MGLASEEQETVIWFCRNDPGAIIDTSDSTVINRLNRLVEKSDHYSLIEIHMAKGEEVGRKFSVDDKKMISFRSQKTKRVLTDEQKVQIAERLKEARG